MAAKGYVTNWTEEAFVIKNVKNTVLRTCVISDLYGEVIIGRLAKQDLTNKTNKTCKRQIKQSLELKK